MTDQELDVIDELHFVQPFSYLLNTLAMEESELKSTLQTLAAKGWVKVLKTVDEEIPVQEHTFEKEYATFFYLATKKGLLAFHSTGE
jgi:hypothetical protein